jgi:hypothetical protein
MIKEVAIGYSKGTPRYGQANQPRRQISIECGKSYADE